MRFSEQSPNPQESVISVLSTNLKVRPFPKTIKIKVNVWVDSSTRFEISWLVLKTPIDKITLESLNDNAISYNDLVTD